MSQDVFYILTPPNQLPCLREFACRPAHLAYRISPNLRLTRAQGTQNLRGGVMTVADCPDCPRGEPSVFCMDIARECAFRGYQGVILDLERTDHPLCAMLPRLEQFLSRQGVTLFVPEQYAARLRSARVLISSALSGGSLSNRLREAAERFGRERLVLAVEKTAADFLLPAPTGNSCPIPPEHLSRLTSSPAFFSPQLCANYSTYRDADGGVHFLLWDDPRSISQKLEQARQAGIHTFLLPWAEISACPEQCGLPRIPAKKG